MRISDYPLAITQNRLQAFLPLQARSGFTADVSVNVGIRLRQMLPAVSAATRLGA
jgi:hypothetical protein